MMKKLDVISPVNSQLVTILQDVNCATGSVAINDEFHDMFVSINGKLIGPLGAGRYKLDPRFSPFFTRIKTLPTGGNAPINVTIFYVSTKNYTIGWGTGEITCNEKILTVSMPIRIYAGGSMIFKVNDSRLFLQSLVGLRGFNVNDLEQSTRALIVPGIRSSIVSSMSAEQFISAQTNLPDLSRSASGSLTDNLSQFGLSLTTFSINQFTIHQDDLAKLQELNTKRVEKATELEALSNEISTVYGGNVYDRAHVQALLNLSQNQDSGSMSQFAMLPALWNMGERMGAEMQNTFNRPSPRMPQPIGRTCPNCHNTYNGNIIYCPNCGHQLN